MDQKMRIFLSFVTMLFALNLSANATENPFGITFYGSYWHTERVPNALFFVDEIKKNDSFLLRKALRNHNVTTIVLSSPGGDVDEGLQMAGIIFDKELATVIPTDGDCASACAFMFFGGKNRLATGRLGVHQFKSSSDGNAKIGQVQAGTQFYVSEIIGFLNEFETPRFVFEKMFQQSEMYYFSQDELKQLNTSEAEVNLPTINKFLKDFTKHVKNTNAKHLKKSIDPKGTKKEFFRILQKHLNKAGCSAGIVDGIYGKKTEQAVKLFAKTANLPFTTDIIYDENFLVKLSSAPKKFCPKQTKSTPITKYANAKALDGNWQLTVNCGGGYSAKKYRGRLFLSSKGQNAFTYNAAYTVDGKSYKGSAKHNGETHVKINLSGPNGRITASVTLHPSLQNAQGIDSSNCRIWAAKR